jgi:hypothetical protein
MQVTCLQLQSQPSAADIRSLVPRVLASGMTDAVEQLESLYARTEASAAAALQLAAREGSGAAYEQVMHHARGFPMLERPSQVCS